MQQSDYILVSGANGNLGKATLENLIEASHKVLAVDRGQQHIAALVDEGKVAFISCNVTDENATAALVKQLDQEGKKISAAILLVGGYAPGSLEETDGELLKKQYTANFESAFFLARPLFSHMKQNGGGRLIMVGAKPGLHPSLAKHSLAYALSKSLVFRLAEVINEEGKDHGITATVIVPGTIDTPQNRSAMPGKNFEDWVKPEAIAAVIRFAISDEAKVLREPVLKVYNNS
jgi:NAD(P)-dependent dehydrogenase (short-subunit alcohol dehydrogenase family)